MWGRYGKRGGWGDVMRPIPSKTEQEEKTRLLMVLAAKRRKALGLPSKAELAARQEALNNSQGVCPVCHIQRSITGACSC